MKFLKQNILLILVFIVVVLASRKFKENINPDLLPSSPNSDKFFKPIRIKFIHGNQAITGQPSLFTDEMFDKFMTNVINPVNKFFQETVRVYQLPPQKIIKQFMCERTSQADSETGRILKFNVDITQFLKEYDYVFIILFINQTGSTASAANIKYNDIGGYSRPACGFIQVNNLIHSDFLNWTIFNSNERKRTFFHEMTHALTFSKNHYSPNSRYIDEKGRILLEESILKTVNLPEYNVKQTYLNHPKIQKLTSVYFNCPNSNGYPLAEGNSHFHQQVIANTIMRPQADSFIDRISIFMLTLYEASGWYKIDSSKAEKTLWGRGKGCEFLNLSCKDKNGNLFDEYCDANKIEDKLGCDYYYESQSQCDQQTKEDYRCNWMVPYESKRCELDNQKTTNRQKFGLNSKCIEYRDSSNKRNGGCYEATCDNSKKEISYIIDGKKYSSTYRNGNKPDTESFKVKIGKSEFTFYFPHYERFCFNILNKQNDKGFRK